MQRRRVHAVTSNLGVAVSHTLLATIDESNGVNAHGMRISFICEPENASANAWGTWALYCLPDEASALPVQNIAVLETEISNAFMWAVGTWAASNETPYCSPAIDLGTSRNCQNGARLVLIINPEGVSAGLVRISSVMSYFTKSL